jgi:nucleotide-binding universal stress UspA family protein
MEKEKKILLAVDLNFETGFVLASAASFFRESAAIFQILHVIPYDIFSFSGKKNSIKSKAEEVHGSIEDKLKESGLYYLNYEISVYTGNPQEEIINFAKKNASDIIAVGTHQRVGIKEIVSGSVSFYVAKHSVCPVLLIPLKNTAKLTAKELIKESALSLINPS